VDFFEHVPLFALFAVRAVVLERDCSMIAYLSVCIMNSSRKRSINPTNFREIIRVYSFTMETLFCVDYIAKGTDEVFVYLFLFSIGIKFYSLFNYSWQSCNVVLTSCTRPSCNYLLSLANIFNGHHPFTFV